MTHDPLCPRASHPQFCEGCTAQCATCQCDLIARVRGDERQRYVDIVHRRTAELKTCGHDNCRTLADGARLALNECLAATG